MIGDAFRRLRRRPQPTDDGSSNEFDFSTVDPGDRDIIERASPYTMTGPARLQALVDAVRYCVRREIPGAFTECGVWRGGSVLAMILTLQDLGRPDRALHLYDTFTGMTEPTEHDVSSHDPPAMQTWAAAEAAESRPWPEFFDESNYNEEQVRQTLLETAYPPDLLKIMAGPVEETLPATAPDEIALLRLDTDWYESTRHELEHLYPRLADGGVLIIDDYGHWEGARRAVDEYFADNPPPLLLSRVDYAGRIAIKH